MLGLYVHIPFCSAICNYCNFNRGLFDARQKTRYVEALVREIHEAGLKACTTTEVVQAFRPVTAEVVQAFRPVIATEPFRPVAAADTIYFGGGTPSLLDPSDVARIIAA